MAGSEPVPVPGVRLGVASAGIKTPGRPDLVVMELLSGSSVAAVFTRNAFCAAPVHVARDHWRRGGVRYLLINTGNANAGTGRRGADDAYACCRALAERCGVEAAAVMPFSTGVIGEYLPVDRLLAGLPEALEDLSENHWQRAAAGIMTTDTRPKFASRRIDMAGREISLTGIAKGAGMIRPDMATMLAFVATDAAIAPAALQALWREAVEQSFNRITIDGDTSTNDAAVLVATGAAGNAPVVDSAAPETSGFRDALGSLCLELAQALVRDGEGASKFVAVTVSAAGSEAEALRRWSKPRCSPPTPTGAGCWRRWVARVYPISPSSRWNFVSMTCWSPAAAPGRRGIRRPPDRPPWHRGTSPSNLYSTAAASGPRSGRRIFPMTMCASTRNIAPDAATPRRCRCHS